MRYLPTKRRCVKGKTIKAHNSSVIVYMLLCVAVISLFSCAKKEKERIVAPWGEVGEDTLSSAQFSVDDIISNGEMIVLTMSGPDTYFDYHGHGMGTQYMICEKFAQKIGVSLRVELCKDTAEMVDRLVKGEADMIMYMIPENKTLASKLLYCGMGVDEKAQWAVAKSNAELASLINEWYKPSMLAEVKKEESYLFSTKSVRRHVYAPYLNRSEGIISKYDNLFRRYAPVARWDWRLLAAQSYQESCFDPNARSWAGACGLMQIMPSTADHLGLARSDMNNPEKSVEAAVRLLAELSAQFRDIPSVEERHNFVLASYNAGSNHIKDAMALTAKYGGNPHRWSNVAPYVLKLQQPQYYNDPVVKYGYMRGSETVDYVDRIRQRYAQYRGTQYKGPSVSEEATPDYDAGAMTPRRATKKYKYHI